MSKTTAIVLSDWILNQSEDFHQGILSSDECTFHSHGATNAWNNRHWSEQNPRWVQNIDKQHQWKLNVWCGVIKDQIIGPYFIEGSLTGGSYTNFLKEDLSILLEDVPLEARANMFYQQDGCPAHTSRIARSQLNEMFPMRWIGKYGPFNWPARSPDLSVLDYYLWGRLKDIVYINRPTDVQDMKLRLRNAIAMITADEVKKAVDHFNHRVQVCRRGNGQHFEQFL